MSASCGCAIVRRIASRKLARISDGRQRKRKNTFQCRNPFPLDECAGGGDR